MMGVTEWVSIISLIVAVIALIYSFASNTKKYELTYQYYNDVLSWHNQVVKVISDLRINSKDELSKKSNLSKLSALIETGRFYFPNVDNNDGFGIEKPIAYQGYRNVVLDFLVFEYQILQKEDSYKYDKHTENLQRLFTSHVFQYLDPKKHNKKIKRNTDITMKRQITINDFLSESPDMIYNFYPIDKYAGNWTTVPTQRKNQRQHIEF